MTEMSVFKRHECSEDADIFGSDSIFAGLSVTTTPMHSSASINVPRADDSALVALSLPSVPRYQPQLEVFQPTAPPMEYQQSPTISTASTNTNKKHGSLQTLYATEIITADLAAPLPITSNIYPEVPNILRNKERTAKSIIASQEHSHSEETESLLGASSSTSTHQPEIHDSQAQMSTTLVNELLQENSRLNAEVEHLRRLLNQPQADAVANQEHSDRLATSRPALAPSAGDAVKYVCCGGCRQWLVAPKTAVYVVCSRCEAVNNCNISTASPTGSLSTNGENVQLESQALIQQRSDVPWFLDCFRQYF